MKLGTLLRSQTLFGQFLLTYLLVLLVPLILALWVNSALVAEFRSTVEEGRLSVLRQTRDVIEASIVELEWRAYQIAGDTRLSQLINEYRNTGTENPPLLREVVSALNSYTLYSSNLKSTFYVYLREPPIILTPYSLYRHEDFDDRRTYLSMEGTSVRAWHETILTTYQRRSFYPARRVTIEDFTSARMIPFVQSFPVRTGTEPRDITGALVYFIAEEEFGGLLDNLDLPDGGWAYISDQLGQLITGISRGEETALRQIDVPDSRAEGLDTIELDGQTYLAIHTSTPEGWSYVAVFPEGPVLSSVFRLQRISLISLSLSLFASMVIASVISFRRARPLQQLLTDLREAIGGDSMPSISITSLNSGVHRLIDRSRHMQDQLAKQEAFNQNQLVNRLLQGSFRNRNEVQSFLSYLRMTITEDGFVAVILSLRGFRTLETVHMIEEMSRTKVVLKELIRSVFPRRTLVYDSEEESISLILLSPEGVAGLGQERLDPLFSRLQDSLASVYHAHLGIGVGNPRSDILEVSSSYEEAKQALGRWSTALPKSAAYFSADLVDQAGYYYPLDLEVKITNAVRAGDAQVLDAAFSLFRSENLGRRNLAGSQLRFLYHELFGTYRKILDNMNPSPPPRQDLGDSYLSGEDCPLDALIDEFFVLAEFQHGSKKSHNKELLDRVLQTVHNNYSDPGLGLYAVASSCSITESYLSFFFKEQTGENFSSYVENLRIKKAVDLLKGTEAAVAEIAELVGYNSDKTFRRVFKKLQGISPSEFRQHLAIRRIL